MVNHKLSKIIKVPLREVFKDEASDFTPWLEKNIDQLSETIGIEIEDVKKETGVGEFSADLVGIEANSENKVIIENQLTGTDHKHLGQLIAYASGVNSSFVIWVSENIREEHQKALEWLNEQASGVSFFGVEVSAVRIDDSPVAINFRSVVEPNTWGREVKQKTEQVDERHQKYLQIFTRLVSEYEKIKSEWGHLTPRPSSWLAFGAGKTGFRFTWAFRGNNQFDVELFIDTKDKDEVKSYFAELEKFKEEIGQKIPSLSWEELPERRASRIALYYNMPNSVKKLTYEQIDELISWAIEKMDLFKQVFSGYIKKL